MGPLILPQGTTGPLRVALKQADSAPVFGNVCPACEVPAEVPS